MLYHIYVTYKNFLVGEYVTAGRENLYMLCWVLDKSFDVQTFIVKGNDAIYSQQDLGYATMEKWVTE